LRKSRESCAFLPLGACFGAPSGPGNSASRAPPWPDVSRATYSF